MLNKITHANIWPKRWYFNRVHKHIFHCIRVNLISYTNISHNIFRYHTWYSYHHYKHRCTLKNVNRFLRALANIGTHWKMCTDVCLSSDWLLQTSVHIEKCKPMFESSSKHWKIFFVEAKTKFHWENHILPNTMRISWLCLGHIGKYGPHASKWGANVTPPACGRQGTLTPHFSAYRAIFSGMSSPESGYSSIMGFWVRFYSNLTYLGLYLKWGSIYWLMQIRKQFQSLFFCSLIFLYLYSIQMTLAFTVTVRIFIWLWTARERWDKSIFILVGFYLSWGCIFSISLFDWGYIS